MMGLTVVNLDGAVDVERNFEVLERVQNRMIDIELLPTITLCECARRTYNRTGTYLSHGGLPVSTVALI